MVYRSEVRPGLEVSVQSRFEILLERNPLRSWVRETMEVAPLRAASDLGTFELGLHIACGNGRATDLILKHFSMEKLSAIDRDPDVIAVPQSSHCRDAGTDTASGTLHCEVDFSVQDVRHLEFPDNIFDVAFDLADLHNFADWREGVTEQYRVLKPGGSLLLEEISRETFSHGAGRLFHRWTAHPYDAMLTALDLTNCLLQRGFEVVRFRPRNPLGLLRYFILVARKP